jgi:hypothetical protein
MDAILQFFMSWQFILFGTAIAAVVFVFRKMVEFFLNLKVTPGTWPWKAWRELVLPVVPVFIGVTGSLLFTNFPYPEGLASGGGRAIFGLVAGLLSGLIYRVIKGMLLSKVKELLPTDNKDKQ